MSGPIGWARHRSFPPITVEPRAAAPAPSVTEGVEVLVLLDEQHLSLEVPADLPDHLVALLLTNFENEVDAAASTIRDRLVEISGHDDITVVSGH
jgi:hypothetical protein